MQIIWIVAFTFGLVVSHYLFLPLFLLVVIVMLQARVTIFSFQFSSLSFHNL